jgi:hypothetical protein
LKSLQNEKSKLLGDSGKSLEVIQSKLEATEAELHILRESLEHKDTQSKAKEDSLNQQLLDSIKSKTDLEANLSGRLVALQAELKALDEKKGVEMNKALEQVHVCFFL